MARGRQLGVKLPYEKQKFYVFYDDNDNVRYCGTAQQLVDEGYYTSINSFHSSVNHIQQNKTGGTVVILRGSKSKKKAVKK
jgi:hypothetical protein